MEAGNYSLDTSVELRVMLPKHARMHAYAYVCKCATVVVPRPSGLKIPPCNLPELDRG